MHLVTTLLSIALSLALDIHPHGYNLRVVEYLTRNAGKGDVTFYYETIDTKTPRKITFNNYFYVSSKAELKILIHDWKEHMPIPWYNQMKKAYFQNSANTLKVEWGKIAALKYSAALRETEIVGLELGNLLITLITRNKMPLKKIHLIGAGLGAHIAAIAGKWVENVLHSQIARLTALDPLHINETNEYKSLSKVGENVAAVVEVVHTDDFLGIAKPIGLRDFYLNGGKRPQPNCINDGPNFDATVALPWANLTCSHARSVDYFVEAINKNVLATRCDTWENYKKKECGGNYKQKFAGGDLNSENSGSYYLDTNPTPPYFT